MLSFLCFSPQKHWYFPKRENRPDLKNAWAYFEHVTLPRRFTGQQSADTRFRRAEPGEYEEDTELYDPFRTPQKAFVEWGVGIDLYFVSVMCFAFFMFVAACVNIAVLSCAACINFVVLS